MRLTEFISDHIEAILEQWDEFARTHRAAHRMTAEALRDHAPEILAAVAEDMAQAQTRQEQSDKSRGLKPEVAGETAAQTHGLLRARHDFDINQLVGEYRALRATVLRLWMDTYPDEALDPQEVIRFNEAIDQAIAESTRYFHGQMERSRNLFLGSLGHDMRAPLNAVVATASYLAALNAGEAVSGAAARLIRSGQSMRALLDDLVDFNRSQLGIGIQISPSDIDLAAALADEVDQLRAAHPERRIEFEPSGDSRGRWDADRLKQLLRNLVVNALQHGHDDQSVHITLVGDPSEVRLAVINRGAEIDPWVRDHLFDPLKRGLAPPARRDVPHRLGLGLFIVSQIARGHGGKVDVNSDSERTTFVVTLPRSAETNFTAGAPVAITDE